MDALFFWFFSGGHDRLRAGRRPQPQRRSPARFASPSPSSSCRRCSSCSAPSSSPRCRSSSPPARSWCSFSSSSCCSTSTAMEHMPRQKIWMGCTLRAGARLSLSSSPRTLDATPQGFVDAGLAAHPGYEVTSAPQPTHGADRPWRRPSPEPVGRTHDDTHRIGRLLFTRSYVAPFEITSLLILVATIGVIVLCKQDERRRPRTPRGDHPRSAARRTREGNRRSPLTLTMEITLNHYLAVAAGALRHRPDGRHHAAQPAHHLHVAGDDAAGGQPDLRRLQPLQRPSRRPGLRLLRHHRRRGGSRRRPGAHRRALPAASRPPRSRTSPPSSSRTYGPLRRLVSSHRPAGRHHRDPAPSPSQADYGDLRLGRLGRALLPHRRSLVVFGAIPEPTPFEWISLPGLQGRHRHDLRSALQGHAPRRHRRRPAHPHLFHRLHGARPGQGPLLRRALHLHVLDDRHRPRRQPDRDVLLLGRRGLQLLSPHRLLVREGERRRRPRTRPSSAIASPISAS